MDNDRQRDVGILDRLAAPALGLSRPGSSVYHRSDEFEVTRIGRQGHRDRATGRREVGPSAP